MRQKMISRRDAFSLLGLAVALGFAVPTTVLTTSDAEAQAAAPATTAPATPATNTPAMSGMERRRAARQTAREMRREARQTARAMRREARQTARRLRREARRGGGQLYMNAGQPTKQ